jgi:endonuclease G, mitochondrial
VDINNIQKMLDQAVRYLDYPNITSVGIGKKIVNGEETDEMAVQFTVNQKAEAKDLESLRTLEIPGKLIADEIEIKTDVVERSYQIPNHVPRTEGSTEYLQKSKFKPSDAGDLASLVEIPKVEISKDDYRMSRQEPIVPGISVNNKRYAGAGTLGCIVYDKENGNPYILSNYHILNWTEGAIGDVIVQPGALDADQKLKEADTVGKLVRSYLGLAGDCAIGSIENRKFLANIYELGVVPKRFEKVKLGDRVVKSGRTTGVTHGIVTRVGMTVEMNYGSLGKRRIECFEVSLDPEFPNQNNLFSEDGDSGSILLLKDRNTGETTDIVVGLHFAGALGGLSTQSYAIACNIDSVLTQLNITLEPAIA